MDDPPAALRHLFNRFLGQLWHCLQTRETRYVGDFVKRQVKAAPTNSRGGFPFWLAW